MSQTRYRPALRKKWSWNGSTPDPFLSLKVPDNPSPLKVPRVELSYAPWNGSRSGAILALFFFSVWFIMKRNFNLPFVAMMYMICLWESILLSFWWLLGNQCLVIERHFISHAEYGVQNFLFLSFIVGCGKMFNAICYSPAAHRDWIVCNIHGGVPSYQTWKPSD